MISSLSFDKELITAHSLVACWFKDNGNNISIGYTLYLCNITNKRGDEFKGTYLLLEGITRSESNWESEFHCR